MKTINWKETIQCDTSGVFVSNPTPKLNETIRISMWIHKDNPIKEVLFASTIETYGVQKPMTRIKLGDFYEKFSFDYKVLTKKVLYYFIVKTHDNMIYFVDNLGLHESTSKYSNQFKLVANLELASWVTDRVFYQIFPDRFAKSGQKYENTDFEYDGFKRIDKEWDDLPLTWDKARTYDHNGGDLEGIRQKINYLKDLGVNALYLNPIFTSPTNHKYHTEDFFEIDPGFGTKEDLINLVESLHSNDIKIVLDGVLNHVGFYHKWFNKFSKYKDDPGAYNSKDSKYYDFFMFNNYPDDYVAWANVPDLPTLDYRSEKLRELIYKNKDSVLQYWLNKPFNIDGWRLDVLFNIGNYPTRNVKLGEEIVREMRQVVKSYDDKFFLGECFHDLASYLQGDKLDSVMNYQGFLNPIWSFLGKERFYILEGGWQTGVKQIENRAEVLQKELSDFRSSITSPILQQMYNLIGSHDTPRVINVLGDAEKVKIAAAIQFTYPGIPTLYYGDEIGLDGENDPWNRKPFNWRKESWNNSLRDFYKKLINLRKSHQVLKTGSYKDLYYKKDVFAFARFNESETFVTIVNAGNSADISIPMWKIGKLNEEIIILIENQKTNIKNMQEGYLNFEIPKATAIILQIK